MPINPKMNLAKEWSASDKLEKAGTRDGFGKGMLEAAAADPRVVGLTADLGESTRIHLFAEKYPARFIQVGVAEQNLVTVASGMAAAGKIPFASGFGAFTPGRNWEQIRTTIAYNDQPVQVVATHTGITVGEDGATHQVLEDIAMMRALPNMRVIVPCDAAQAEKATIAMAKDPKPSYIRLGREKFPTFTTKKTPFVIGKADVYFRGTDVTVFACGPQLYNALEAAHQLRKEISVEVINVHTIKPLDVETIVASISKTKRAVTIEDHQIAGGLGGAIAETLSAFAPAPLERLGVQDHFGESGTGAQLVEHFHMTTVDVVDAIRRVMKRKKSA